MGSYALCIVSHITLNGTNLYYRYDRVIAIVRGKLCEMTLKAMLSDTSDDPAVNPVNHTPRGSFALPAIEPKTDRPETLVQSVVKSLIGYIQINQLKVGDPIRSEGEFAIELGVSRTVVREAFKALAAMNIIEVSAGRRAKVSAFDGAVMALTLSHGLRTEQVTVQQVWDVRRAIEMRTVVLASMHRTDKDVERILELTRMMRETHDDVAAMTEHDIAFHIAIANSARNPLMPVLVSALTSSIRDTNPIVWKTRTHEAEQLEVVEWHVAIAEAIRDRDAAQAMKAMSRHFDEASLGLVNSGFN
jgi:GntR family transcriptional repressor for pyruvate dehydrogenase complex